MKKVIFALMLGLIAFTSCEKEDIEPSNDISMNTWYPGTDGDWSTDNWKWQFNNITQQCECQYMYNSQNLTDTTDQACIDNIGISPDCP